MKYKDIDKLWLKKNESRYVIPLGDLLKAYIEHLRDGILNREEKEDFDKTAKRLKAFLNLNTLYVPQDQL